MQPVRHNYRYQLGYAGKQKVGMKCSCILCLVIFGKDRFLIPAMLLITLVLTHLRRREEGETV